MLLGYVSQSVKSEILIFIQVCGEREQNKGEIDWIMPSSQELGSHFRYHYRVV